MHASKQCDGTSVGVILDDAHGRFAMFDRATAPVGAAWVAGHIDQHGSPEQAAVEESWEELGVRIQLRDLVTIGEFWRPNRCRRTPHARPQDGSIGHQWTLFRAETDGCLNPSDWETRNARWVDGAEIQRLGDRTAAWAKGVISDEAFAVAPGLEPVWVGLALEAGILRMAAEDLASVERKLNGTLRIA